MLGIRSSSIPSCSCCLRAVGQAPRLSRTSTTRNVSDKASPPRLDDNDGGNNDNLEDKPQGAMSQRLEQMSEESLETGGRAARKAVEEAGFSEELKSRLEKRLADSSFRSDNAAAFAQANMPQSAPKHARETAAARPWSGSESIEDASLRMLNDAHKPLRTVSRSPGQRGPPRQVDTGRPSSRPGTGVRLASARDQASVYSQSVEQQKGKSEEERETFRREMKARFMPGARSVAASVQGLNSLANQRIEDAIARGQFKNLPNRGKKMERDHNADSPFINTTEYFMNKMIKKQEIVPPWIEKQQEVISTANAFRKRLRSDWKRHVSRMIASRGGDLSAQLKLAEEYAFAESLENPSKQQIEKMNAVDDQGHLSQITISGELKTAPTDDATRLEEEIKVLEQTFDEDGSLKPIEQVTVTAEQPLPTQQPAPEPPRRPTVAPFRDLQWEQTERSYHNLAIQQLNSLTRSYNLMAPDLAKKPYFSLERELRSCFADVAPQIAAAIQERAFKPKLKGVEVIGHRAGSFLDKFSMDKASQVHEDQKPRYGFKEFWRDLFAPPKT
ncbi:hypothetical protein AC578_4378 [Pseudocercospora eumusae]|uniref:DnaJ homologue subfamily C member 28 conserved domain-containing protein n=1 Tax=Pseudocercospora eumusae TaxID=321146 RepID=A0A139H6C2_9PEZI|nr:hypothetical protein AC578_4378 [Pseudocercospora eumusae]